MRWKQASHSSSSSDSETSSQHSCSSSSSSSRRKSRYSSSDGSESNSASASSSSNTSGATSSSDESEDSWTSTSNEKHTHRRYHQFPRHRPPSFDQFDHGISIAEEALVPAAEVVEAGQDKAWAVAPAPAWVTLERQADQEQVWETVERSLPVARAL